jgi:hypothetical protein
MDGDYVVQVRLQRNSRDYIRGLVNKPHQIDVRLDGERVTLFTIGGEKLGVSSGVLSTAEQGDVEQEHYERYADEALEIRFPAKAGVRLLTVSFLKETAIPEDPLYTSQSIIDYAQFKGGLPGVDRVTVGGPYDARVSVDTPSRKKIYVCQPKAAADETCAKKILSALARHAYLPQAGDQCGGGRLDGFLPAGSGPGRF